MKSDLEMRVAIDASNLRTGGGLSHLINLLSVAEPEGHGFSQLVVFAEAENLRHLPKRSCIEYRRIPAMRSPAHIAWWQQWMLPKMVRRVSARVLLAPGGAVPLFRRCSCPVVSMCRNMLPFVPEERSKYGMSPMGIRLAILRILQAASFRRSDGVIFLTSHALDTLRGCISGLPETTAIIPHGVEERFRSMPREQEPAGHYSAARPFRLLYVSIIDLYKNQIPVIRAVHSLRQRGLPLTLELVGTAYRAALTQFTEAARELDPTGSWIRYRGPVPYDRIHDVYRDADAFVYASQCENMPNILLEAMAAGLPIACAGLPPMSQIAGRGAVYMDPRQPESIAAAIECLFRDPDRRRAVAQEAHTRALAYSWNASAGMVFQFLREIRATGAAVERQTVNA